jgi:hypothetical protein
MDAKELLQKEEEFAKCLDLKELTKATLLDDELIN